MLSLFTMPKPFVGHIGIIQRNAIGSWRKLHPDCEILIFGDEEGTASFSREHGIRYVPQVARNEYGTPLVNDLFDKAQRLARHDVLCFVNSDIVLLDDFVAAVEKVSQWKKRFLAVGECRGVNLLESLPFQKANWERDLRALAREEGTQRGPWAIDYVAFRRGLYEGIPPFAIGRAGFDNWLIWKARVSGAAVVDMTRTVCAIHQNHDYFHVVGGKAWSYEGAEAQRNNELGGGPQHRFFIHDSNYRLETNGFKRNLWGYFRLRFRLIELKSRIKLVLWSAIWRVLVLTRPIRHRIGLRQSTFTRLKASVNRQRQP
jgi:hypothetical protein